MAGIDAVQVAGEASDVAEPLGPPRRLRVGRLHGPRHGHLGADPRDARVVEVLDEAGQDLAGPLQLVAQRAPQIQVLLAPGRQRVRSPLHPRPLRCQGPQPVVVDRGVDGGRTGTAMSQNLAYWN
jgi:hypothetical protein